MELLVKTLEFAQVRRRQGLHVHGPGDALAGREEPGDVTEQVPLGQRGRAVRRRYGDARQVEERGGELRVNLLVRPDRRMGTVRIRKGRSEIEERLPADEAPGGAGTTAQVDGVSLAFARRVEDHP